ncbi:MAG: hypothetical protein K9J12_03805 [Melioribacteraceae bacterium]|nr:hypothetical protein [Melioribacteraceae bacterium]MCF8263224.1 hypothetical protein [Melioribacteraceae bacterium]MCF8431012.1 hypothetical protein [Melioribacteraceae bacterium]
MKNFILLLAVVIFIGCEKEKAELENLTDSKRVVSNYYESGKHSEELTELIQNFITETKHDDYPNNAAVIFDIDETVLSNYDYIKKIDFGYEYKLWDAYMQKASAEAIPEVKNLYTFFLQEHYHIIFLTARKQSVYDATIINLMKEGFTVFDTVICKSEDYGGVSSADFKAAERKRLTEAGYEIIATIGDQNSDLVGEFTGKKLKLPNYLYRVK